ncbi:MAG: hypothetical protein AAGG44_14440, partial [Planctomycetota bacterium]
IDLVKCPEPCVAVTERDDGQSLATAILELAMDHARRTRTTAISQKRAEQYRWESIGPMWDQILESIQ